MENQTYEKVNDVELEITKVSLKVFEKEPHKIDQIRFETTKGDITIRPKIENNSFQDGFEIKKKDSLRIDQMPEKLKELAKKLQEENKVKMKVNYTLMKGDVDGEETEYRFLNNVEQLEEWSYI